MKKTTFLITGLLMISVEVAPTLALDNPLRGEDCELLRQTPAFALTGESLGVIEAGAIIQLVTRVPPRAPNASPQGTAPLRMVEQRPTGEMFYIPELDYTEQCQKNQ